MDLQAYFDLIESLRRAGAGYSVKFQAVGDAKNPLYFLEIINAMGLTGSDLQLIDSVARVHGCRLVIGPERCLMIQP